MSKIEKIIVVLIVLFGILTLDTYAKYNYKYTLSAYSLTRNASQIYYGLTTSKKIMQDGSEYVLVKIIFDRPMYNIEGFECSEDKKTFTRNVIKNEIKTIIAEDYSGNKKEITYEVDSLEE